MKVNKILIGCLFLLSATVSSISFAAPIVSIAPEESTATVGESIFVDILWDGSDGSYISSFDVDVIYDSAVVSFVGAVVDPLFGIDSLGCIPGFSCDAFDSGGVTDVFAFSFFDSAADVVFNQDFIVGHVFSLATLEFMAVGVGETLVEIDADDPFLIFGDEFGLEMFTPELVGGRICVGLPGTDVVCGAVPEPATLPVLLLGLFGLYVVRRSTVA
jgi:hypothetical protein